MSDENMIHFGTLHPDGSMTDERTLSQAAIKACPHFIMMPEHYRADGTCRCNDPEHTIMEEWEYTWNGEVWV